LALSDLRFPLKSRESTRADDSGVRRARPAPHGGASAPLEFKPLPQDDPKRRQPDTSKTQAGFGLGAEVGLEEGLLDMIEHLQTLGSPALVRLLDGPDSLQTLAAAPLPSLN
jgi:hypothetical protein